MPAPPAKKQTRPAKPRPQRLPAIEVDIERLSDEGIGIGRHEFKEVVVPGAFPGERVAAAVEHEGQRRVIGRLLRILKRSPDRIPSPCQHERACQGCPLISMDYAAQLRFKEERVRRTIRAFVSLSKVAVRPPWGAEHPFAYRTNAKLAFSKIKGVVKIGLYRRGTHDVVDLKGCPLHHPLINRIVDVVREEVTRQNIFVYDQKTGKGLLRYLAVRVSPQNGKAMVTFITAERNFREMTHLAKWLVRKVPEVVAVHQNVNPSSGNVVFGRETVRLLGAPDLIDQVGQMRLRIAPTSFFQVNNEQAARIYDLVRQWAKLSKDERGIDLYCGIGGIALHLALDAGSVIGIETVEEAVRNARENARMNSLDNCSFRAGDAEDLIHDIEMEGGGSVVVLNPPRGGCEESVLEAVAGMAPRTILYVSCNPETLARDLDILSGMGYGTEEVQPVDMFPQTAHVESVARLVPSIESKKHKSSEGVTSTQARSAAPAPSPRKERKDTPQRSSGKGSPRGKR